MKLILLSDLQLSWDRPEARLDKDYVGTELTKLRYVLDYAAQEHAVILQAGDFFDAPRSWRMLSAVIDVLNEFRDVKIYTIYGQHDLYMRNESSGSTSLGLLAKAGYVHILNDKHTRIGKNVGVYGSSFGQEPPKLEMVDGVFCVLVVHAPILIEQAWKGQTDFHYANTYLDQHREYDLILCGDIHRKFYHQQSSGIDIIRILNTGPMMREEANEYNFTHVPAFVLFDTDSRNLEWIIIPHRPAVDVLTRDHIERAADVNEMLDKFIGSVQTENLELGVSFKENLIATLKAMTLGEGVVAVLEEVMQQKVGDRR
jgi:hypothetical protein